MVPVLIIAVIIIVMSNVNLGKDYKTGTIESDGKGYYAYLPAVLIYHDLSFRFFYQVERVTYHNPGLYYAYLREHNGHTINKYYSGTALSMLPFFCLGHLTTLLTDLPTDGYSYYYTLWVHLGAIFYLFIGLIAIRKLLRSYQIKEKWIALTLAIIVFGTNLFYYVLTEYSMSHVYSFAWISLFMAIIRKYFLEGTKRSFVLSALLLGIIFLIRPVNLLIIFIIPFLAGNPELLFQRIKDLIKAPLTLLTSAIIFIVTAGLQAVIYKIQTGSFFVYSYPGEGFDFGNPQILNMLISYRKGLFVYTPVYLLSLVGIYFLGKKLRYQALLAGIFLFLITYVFSSWHMWYYGGSFSQRVFIDYLPVFAIFLSVSFQQLPQGWIRKSFITTTILLTLFCQYQTYQYRHMVIHWSDMNKESYWNNMFKITP